MSHLKCCHSRLKNPYFFLLGLFLESWTMFNDFFSIWDPIWSHFCFLGVIFGALWLIFCVKNESVAPKVPRERPKAPTPEIKSRFGIHVGVVFCRFSNFFFKKQVCKICVCKGVFFLWFVDPLKLARKGSRSSPSTLFAYSPSCKKVPKGTRIGTIWGAVFR